jgi:GNAT superfamily N-acetyltransferase
MLTFERLHAGIDPGHVALGAHLGDELVGVAIADVASTPQVARLKSVVVPPRLARSRIGQALLAEVERHVVALGVRRLETIYDGTSSTASTMTHMLCKAGWHRPDESVLLLTASMRITEAPWMRARLSDDCTVFAWADLSGAEADQLAGAHWYPRALGPFPDEAVESACSIGVRCAGTVVGWMLTHRVAPHAVRYGRLFVRPEYRARACGVALIAEALRRQQTAGIAECLCAVSSQNTAMLRIVERRIAPYLKSRRELCFAAKNLMPHPRP